MNLKYFGLSLIILVALVIPSQAAWQACGSMQGWNNSDSNWDLYDDGSHGDVSGGDNIYSFSTTIATAGNYEWKVVTTGSWSGTYPSGSNSWFQTTTDNQAITFYFDRNSTADGFLPAQNIVYTSDQPAKTGFYVAVGDWQSLVGGSNWDPANLSTQMFDDATHGDGTTGDGIYTLNIPISAPGTYQYKVALDTAWTHQIGGAGGDQGFNTNANVTLFAVLVANDTVKFEVNTIKGRIKVKPTVTGLPGPPWYAVGDVQGATLDTTLDLMYDDGTNGDATPADGIYTKRIVVPTYTSGSTHWFSVVDAAANRYPPSSGQYGCPYVTTYDNQTVKFFFDTNSHTIWSLWIPQTKRVYTEATTVGNRQYILVGCQAQFRGFGSDWDQTDTNFALHDDGLYGDQTAGDNIYSYQGTFPNSFSGGFKVSMDLGWDLQIGGDGRSFHGNPGTFPINANAGSTWLFEADIVTGLIRAYDTANPPQPTAVSQNIWMLFE
ncbi:MAG: choice-of-anchor X domain-containing protein [bacterium]